MELLSKKLIICGVSLLLFGIIIAIVSQSPLPYIVGGLGFLIGLFMQYKLYIIIIEVMA